MRVLVVSHNVFSRTESMGKTLSGYFNGFNNTDVAQFYIHPEVPKRSDICTKYFRITDIDAIKSIITRKCGEEFSIRDNDYNENNLITDNVKVAKIYQKSRSRTPFTYFVRNLIWSLSAWNSKKLKKWLNDFAPEAVFFASGDYAFMYKIALKIAKERKIPLYVSCMDDYYFYNKNADKFGGKIMHKYLMKHVNKTMTYATAIFSICDKMTEDYSELLKVPTYTLHTGTSNDKPLAQDSKSSKISYIGNLGYNRHLQLVNIGKALLKVQSDNKPSYIDVYSAEEREEVLSLLNPENGINFHGKISAEEVKKVMADSMILIHTESFDKSIRKTVAYSVSTKIADSLASGTCLMAYGPAEVASISYLKDNNAAFCIDENDDLVSKLKTIINNEELRSMYVNKALELANRNHNMLDNSRKIISVLTQNQALVNSQSFSEKQCKGGRHESFTS